jgi:hypothetical protein
MPPSRLFSILRPGDFVKYRSEEGTYHGKIISRNGQDLSLRRYNLPHQLDLLLPPSAEVIPELIRSENEDDIGEEDIEGIILILGMADLTSFRYTPEGISNCFFLRQRQDTLVYFSSVSFILIESLRCIQQSLHSIFNTNRIGQVLKGFRRIWLSPIAWIYLTERLASLGVVTLPRQGRRTKRIIGPEFVKQSNPITINIEKVRIPFHGMGLLRSILGRYIGLGTRPKFPNQVKRVFQFTLVQ